MAAAVVIEALILSPLVWSHSDVDSFTRTGKEWYLVESYLRFFRGIERQLHRITKQDLLFERAVGFYLYQECTIVLFRHVVHIALHRRKSEALCVVALNTTTYGDTVRLQPVRRQRIRIVGIELL